MHTDGPQSQGLGHFTLGEYIPLSRPTPSLMKKHFVTPGFLVPILDLFLLKPLHRFAIDRTSRVSPLRFRVVTLFPKYVLIGPSSIAIWDRSKIVMAISIGLWVTNASVIILSESFPLYPLGIPIDAVRYQVLPA
jgi:hypothetical protein